MGGKENEEGHGDNISLSKCVRNRRRADKELARQMADLYLSSYGLWPLWQGRLWRVVATSSVDVWILKLHGLKRERNIGPNVIYIIRRRLKKHICTMISKRD